MAVINFCADQLSPLYKQKLALTWTTSGGRSAGKIRLRTKIQGVRLFIKVPPLTNKYFSFSRGLIPNVPVALSDGDEWHYRAGLSRALWGPLLNLALHTPHTQQPAFS
jgi:hypothetical protein